MNCSHFGHAIPHVSREEKGEEKLCNKPLLCRFVALSGREHCNRSLKTFYTGHLTGCGGVDPHKLPTSASSGHFSASLIIILPINSLGNKGLEQHSFNGHGSRRSSNNPLTKNQHVTEPAATFFHIKLENCYI